MFNILKSYWTNQSFVLIIIKQNFRLDIWSNKRRKNNLKVNVCCHGQVEKICNQKLRFLRQKLCPKKKQMLRGRRLKIKVIQCFGYRFGIVMDQ